MNIENLLESKRRELESKTYTSGEYVDLYKDIENERLRLLFSYLHGGFIDLFRTLNERLPTKDIEAHFWADPSRDLIFIIETTFSLQGALKQTELSFIIDDYYDDIIKSVESFCLRVVAAPFLLIWKKLICITWSPFLVLITR